MQLAGEFKRLNLIPVKKAVLDPRKGLLLRTYYVNPEKFFESVLRQKLKRSAIYLAKLPESILKAEQEKSLSPLKEVVGEEAFKVVLKKQTEDLYVPFTKPKESLQKGTSDLLRFVLLLDKKALTKSKRGIEKSGTLLFYSEKEKIKKAKRIKARPKKVKEQQSSSQNTVDNLWDSLILLDGAQVKVERQVVETKSPIVAGENLTRVLSLLNPAPEKVVAILSSYAGTNFEDKKDIVKNAQISQTSALEESKSISPILYNLIVSSEKALSTSEGVDKVSLKALYYNYCTLLRLSKSEASELIVAFERSEVYAFLKTLKEKGIESVLRDSEKYASYSYCIPIFSSLEDLVSYILKEKDLSLLYASAYRSDTTPALLERLLSLVEDFNPSKTYSDLLIDLSKYYTGQVDSLKLKHLLRLTSVARVVKVPFIPYNLAREIVEAKKYPFSLNFIPKVGKKLLDTEALEFLKNSLVNREIEAFVPIRNSVEKSIQNRRLLPLDVAFIDKDTIDAILSTQGRKVDFVPVKLKGYFKVDRDSSIVAFLPSQLV